MKKFLFLLTFGIIGISTLYLNPLPKDLPELLFEKFSYNQVKILTMLNPTILLVLFTFIGFKFADRFQLNTPIIDEILHSGRINIKYEELIRCFIYGFITSLFFLLLKKLFSPLLPNTFFVFENENSINPITSILYGGITEELIARYGIMTSLVLLLSYFSKKNMILYYIPILISALIFAILHLPALFAFINDINSVLIIYIIIGNFSFGIVAGWLFWKKGLEYSVFVHMSVHISLFVIESLGNKFF
jgi:hypothetical protein